MKSSKLPIQVAPVERTIAGSPMSSGNGVEASFDWRGLVGTAVQALPSVLGAFGI